MNMFRVSTEIYELSVRPTQTEQNKQINESIYFTI